jgi:hypothetical protein
MRTLLNLGLRNKHPLVAGNWDRSGRIRKTLMDGDALLNRWLLSLNLNLWLLIDTRLLAMLCRRNSLLMTGLAHKLTAIYTTHICRLILATLMCVRLVLNAELNILTLNEILVAVARKIVPANEDVLIGVALICDCDEPPTLAVKPLDATCVNAITVLGSHDCV